jgi:cyclohexanecarboxylate-CoA ligase
MIPVNDVESAVRDHPAVVDVAIVGFPHVTEGELACAVVVAEAEPPTLSGLRAYLTDLGMTDWYQPRRLEIVPALPRNSAGKVRKELLQRWLRGEAALTD